MKLDITGADVGIVNQFETGHIVSHSGRVYIITK